jgi:hypothetical protein
VGCRRTARGGHPLISVRTGPRDGGQQCQEAAAAGEHSREAAAAFRLALAGGGPRFHAPCLALHMRVCALSAPPVKYRPALGCLLPQLCHPLQPLEARTARGLAALAALLQAFRNTRAQVRDARPVVGNGCCAEHVSETQEAR